MVRGSIRGKPGGILRLWWCTPSELAHDRKHLELSSLHHTVQGFVRPHDFHYDTLYAQPLTHLLVKPRIVFTLLAAAAQSELYLRPVVAPGILKCSVKSKSWHYLLAVLCRQAQKFT